MKKSKKKILITGFFGVNNLGDDIMLKCFYENIYKHYPEIDITLMLLYGESDNIKLPNNIKIIKLNKLKYGKKYLIKYIISNKYDGIFWIGGTCFTDKAGDGIYNYMKIFKEKKKIFGYIGVGIGDMIDSKRIEQTNYLIRNADLITFRDIESYEKALNIRRDGPIYLCEDLVYLMNDNKIAPSKTRKTLVISWRSLSKYYNNIVENNAINILCSFVYKIHNDFDEIIIMPVGDSVDLEINNSIYNKIIKGIDINKVKFYITNDIEDKIEIINSSKLYISGRLHGAFISEINNINTIAVGYDNKIYRFLKSINKEEDLIYPEEFTIDGLIKKYYTANQVNHKEVYENYIKSQLNIKYFINFIKEKEKCSEK